LLGANDTSQKPSILVLIRLTRGTVLRMQPLSLVRGAAVRRLQCDSVMSFCAFNFIRGPRENLLGLPRGFLKF
jgi:hypothetical protein